MSSIYDAEILARLEHLTASNAVFQASINYDKFNQRVVQRMGRHIASLHSRIKEFQDYLYDYGGPSEYYDDLEDLKEELYECRLEQRENLSHGLLLEQKLRTLEYELKQKELYLDSLEIQHLQQKSECVKHKVVDEQPKVCDNSSLELALDFDSMNVQHVENDKVSKDIVCSEDICFVEPRSEIVITEPSDELGDSAIVQVEAESKVVDTTTTTSVDENSTTMDDSKEDNHVPIDFEALPFVPSALHEHDVELIGDIVAEIEPEPPPIIVFKLLDFDDPMLRASCLLIQQDLRTNLLKGGGNDTPIMCTLGAVCEYEDHHEASKGRFDSYGVFGLHGVAWKPMEAHPCLWESMEAKWMKNKHVKKKKGFVQCLWPYGLVISLIIVH